MRNQKLLAYIFSSSLLISTLPFNTVDAEVSEESPTQLKEKDIDDNKKQSSSDENNESTKDTNNTNKETTKNDDDEINQPSSSTKTRNKNTLDKKESTYNKQDEETLDNQKLNPHQQDIRKQTYADYYKNSLDFFKPAPFKEQKNSTPSLWEQIFSNSGSSYLDVNKTEQGQNNENKTENKSDHSIITDSDEEKTSTSQNESHTDITNNQEDELSNTHENNKLSQDDNEVLRKLDEANSSIKESHSESVQENENQEEDSLSQQDIPEQDKSEQSKTEQDNTPSDNEADSERQNKKATDTSQQENEHDDSVINAILDEYSEDAKKQKDKYDNQNEANDTQEENKKVENQHSNTSTANPQLPTQSQLEDKTDPKQSFEDGLKQSNNRSTAMFQLLPDLSNNDENNSDFNVAENSDTRQFIKKIAEDSHDIGQNRDIYASVMIAQAILESDSGNSALAQSPHYNLFGIKGSYQGKSADFNTLEDSGNSMYQISAQFRSYPSEKESLEDYAELIKNGIDGNSDIYRPTWKSEASSYRDATAHLAKTYATDTQYADKLNSIIKHYDLTQFDKKQMPDLNNYQPSSKENASDFKPFAESTSDSPYPHGQCTWYVYNRMAQFDKQISGTLGDARNWNNRAENKGYTVTSTPEKYNAVVFEAGQQNADPIYGHVAFVEKVNSDGSIVISESNVEGLGVISYRTIDADDAAQLSYIKGK